MPTREEQSDKPLSGLWRVVSIDRASQQASATSISDEVTTTIKLNNAVVVAEFRDPIYPGLISTGKIERGGDRPFHVVINAENFHALETLLFTHRGKIDAIYIDPPYNTGARDWKYNNDYVEGDDLYRHSKWLAFMERRLLLAKELLNPEDSVLIVTIDEKEVHRLGLLIEDLFPNSVCQMVTIVISPLGQARKQEFARVEEYAFFVFLGSAEPAKVTDDLLSSATSTASARESAVRWERLIRGGTGARRQDSPALFFPVFVDPKDRTIGSVGDPIPLGADRNSTDPPDGLVAVWPVNRNGQEGRWRCSPSYLRALLKKGYAKVGAFDAKNNRYTILYLGKAQIRRIESGEIEITERNEAGAVVLKSNIEQERATSAKTVWNRLSHRAGENGTAMVKTMLPGRTFPFPKSLYAVEDCLRIATKQKPNALIVDFFAGSGTTAHAVMRLNKQDDGRRRSIIITNNEVAADEQRNLRKRGLRPGDAEWEKWGICDYITKPRIEAAITGRTPEGDPIQGDYRFNDEFPMADGFEENAEFFTLSYEVPLRVASNREFAKISPLLWMRAGSQGRRIEDIANGWAVAQTYGVLVDLDHTEEFLQAIANGKEMAVVFIVTDEDRLFESVASELPDHIEPVRLYEAYLRNFEIESGRGAQ